MFVLSLFFGLVLIQTPSQTGKTVWDGVYTSPQAARGEKAFMEHCVRCHKEDLQGIDGALKGDFFWERRREDNLETFYLDMKALMPRGPLAGKLPETMYTDLVAYVLKANTFPAGNEELKPEVMEGIRVVGKDGPQPVPNFAPVSVVGCLVDAGPNAFALMSAGEPARTRNSFEKIDKESQFAQNRPFGSQKFRLQDAENFGASEHLGKKVMVKGVLVRSSATNVRVNVNYIEEIRPDCQ